MSSDQDRRLRQHAGMIAGYVELFISSLKDSIGEVSRDSARSARMDVRDAIALLQAFELALSQRIGD